MDNPQVFKADPTAVNAGKFLQVGALLTALPKAHPTAGGRPFDENAKDVDDHIAFKDDQVVAYDDHLEQKHGVATNEIYFKDITNVEVLRTPEEKIILYITIERGSEKNIFAGLERMDDLLKIITDHVGQSLIKESI